MATYRLSSKFYRGEADRLLELTFITHEPDQRLLLLETAARFRRMAATIEATAQAAATANSNSKSGSRQA